MIIPKPWVKKKAPTSPLKKEKHIVRKLKMEQIHEILRQDWEDQIKEYNNNNAKTIL